MNLPHWPGWHLIGAFESDVGSWLLHDAGDAMLLEIPEGLRLAHVRAALGQLGVKLRYVAASHVHEDHFDEDCWASLVTAFPHAEFIHPARVRGERVMRIGGEPVWLIGAPKHSATDVVTVFRGVAMTGDIELGMLDSVNNEVPPATKRRSMAWLAGFQQRHGYHVHSIVSAHLDDVRTGVNWPELFAVGPVGDDRSRAAG